MFILFAFAVFILWMATNNSRRTSSIVPSVNRENNISVGSSSGIIINNSGNNVPDKLNIQRLPEEYDCNYQVKSTKNNGIYLVNPFMVTCTCKDFNKKHSHFEICDIRRFCRHLAKIYIKYANVCEFDRFKIAVLSSGQGSKQNYYFLCDKSSESSEEKVLIVYDYEYKWWDVYAEESDGKLKRYGFDIIENRWSHNEGPPVIWTDLQKTIVNLISSEEAKVSDDLLAIREIISNVRTTQQLKNLEKRLERAEKKYSDHDCTLAAEKKYFILCEAFDIAQDKICRWGGVRELDI